MPTDDANDDAELQALVAAGRKIEAIKRYRELTGVGLAEAKSAVEALMRDASLPSGERGEVPFEAEIISLLEQGKKIVAIKLYREKTGVGLKEAKDFIEALGADRRITVPSRSGCLGVVLFVAAVLVIVVAKSFAAEDREAALKQRYDAFVKSLDHRRLAEDYPGAVRNLDSLDPKKQIVGIKTLAATDEVKAIPWIVPFLDSEDGHVRIYAGQALNVLVATHELKRRDKSQPEKVVILPPGPGDIDLKPMSWVILKMLRKSDDGNTHAFAANMIGYLGIEEYEAELRGLLESRHPAVTQAAQRALEMIGASTDCKDEASTEDLIEQPQKPGLRPDALFQP